MSSASTRPTSLLSESSQCEARANSWRGSTSSSSSRSAKTTQSSVRKIKRKPVPAIPISLLQHELSPISTKSTSTAPLTTPARVLAEKSLIIDAPAAAIEEPKISAAPVPPPKSPQPPQKQYLLSIDTPTASSSTSETVDSVKQLLRSTTLPSASASSRSRRGPLKWMQDKEEHAPAVASNPSPANQTSLGRKSSILKMSLRRNRGEGQHATALNISGPTDFVHVSTSAEAPTAKEIPLRRPTNRVSVLSSASSSSGTSLETAASSTVDRISEDKPLYVAAERKYPLRPLKSIRRPSKATIEKAEPSWVTANEPTSPKDKRKAIYAAPATALPLTEHFATDMRARGRLSDYSEPDLSRGSSSGDESSGESNRSSLVSLQEFKSFLDFGEERRGDGKREENVWTNERMALPIVLEKF